MESMGEKIKNLGKIDMQDTTLEVELNKGTHKTGMYDIHIQNKQVRLNMNEYDFSKLASGIIYASEKMKQYKEKI